MRQLRNLFEHAVVEWEKNKLFISQFIWQALKNVGNTLLRVKKNIHKVFIIKLKLSYNGGKVLIASHKKYTTLNLQYLFHYNY